MALPEDTNIHPAGAGTPTIRPSGGEGGPGLSSGSVRHLAAMYETHAQAHATREKLADAGIASGDMNILDHSAGPTDPSFGNEQTDAGLWGAIKRMFMPDNDAHAYAEGVTRGHSMLYVRPKAEQLETAIDILEDSGPLDLDARESEWRSAGWNGTHAGQAPYEARMTPRVPDTAGSGGTAHDHPLVGRREAHARCVRVRSYVVEGPVVEQECAASEATRTPHKVPPPATPPDAPRE